MKVGIIYPAFMAFFFDNLEECPAMSGCKAAAERKEVINNKKRS